MKKTVGTKFRPTFESCIDHFEVRGYDEKRQMVLTTVYPKDRQPFDDSIEAAYYDAAFDIIGDYRLLPQE